MELKTDLKDKKILFWLDGYIIHFGIASYLQKILDSEFYAIISVNEKIKKFYQNQTFVNFEKSWYFRDNINHKSLIYDIEYLKKFELKYGISLWKLVYGERFFYQYTRYHIFSHDEILAILESECRFYEKIFTEIKPDYLIMKTTDYQQQHLLYLMAKSLKIKILMMGPTRLGYRSLISNNADKLDDHVISSDSSDTVSSFEELKKIIEGYNNQVTHVIENLRSSKSSKLSAGIKFLQVVESKDFKNYYANSGKTLPKILVKETIFTLKGWYRKKFLEKNSLKFLPENEKFVYFPLHLEPERTVSIPAPYYTNQIETAISIAKSLPVDYFLYVKEHPAMRLSNWRNLSDYKQLLKLPNVKLIHPNVSNKLMLENCEIVVTIAGSSGLEAAFYQKPSIVLSDTIYTELPSVTKIDSFSELPEQILKSLLIKVNLSDLVKFVQKIENNSFIFNEQSLHMNANSIFFYDGFLIDVEIEQESMKHFLENNRDDFKILAKEHLKKILQFEKLI